MSAELSEKPTDSEASGLQEPQGGKGPNDTLPLLDRDEILRKRRERRKAKQQEKRRLRYHLSRRRGGLNLVSERMFNLLKEQSKSDHHYAKTVDLILETAAKAKELKVTNNVKAHSYQLNKVNRGKTRENPRRYFTTLKKKLLKFRKEKGKSPGGVAEKLDEVTLDTNKESAEDPLKLSAGYISKVDACDVFVLDIPKQPAEDSSKLPAANIQKVVEKLDNLSLQPPKESERDLLTLSAANIPKLVETFNEHTLGNKKESGDDSVQLPLPNIHSRKFRSYCDNTTPKEICDLTENLLRKLFSFQKRAYEKNAIKARAHRRYVVGFNEVQRLVTINKAKLVIIAPDCEPADFPGGLDEIVNTLKCKCKERDIPYIFSLRRRSLAYCLFRKVPVSCVAISSYDGAQEIFQQLMDILTIEREKYASLL